MRLTFLKTNIIEPGDFVKTDEIIVSIETDKVVVDIRAPEPGVITKVFADKGATVAVSADLYQLDTAAKAPSKYLKVGHSFFEAGPPKEAPKPSAEPPKTEAPKTATAPPKDPIPISGVPKTPTSTQPTSTQTQPVSSGGGEIKVIR